ncbi:MAG: hypothetical protein ABUK20_08335 [Anaerolineales bacterium]
MNKSLLLGFSRYILPIPRIIWQRVVSNSTSDTQDRLDFMTKDHHRVREHVVLELPKVNAPISPQQIAESLDLPIDRVNFLLDDLEKHMTFLYRNGEGAVTWAYPVTVDQTPHRVDFSSGEQIYAA